MDAVRGVCPEGVHVPGGAHVRVTCPTIVPVTRAQNVRDLGIHIDRNLSMRTYVQQTTSSCFAALRQLRQIRRLVPTATFQTLTVALVNQRLVYGNSTLVGIPAYIMCRLQSALNAAARLIFHPRRSDHVTDALVSLQRSESNSRSSC